MPELSYRLCSIWFFSVRIQHWYPADTSGEIRRTADRGRDARGFEVDFGGLLRGDGEGGFLFSFAALSIYFHFAFDWLSFDFFPRSAPGGSAGFGSWTVCTIRGIAAPLGCGRGADSRAGMPVRPAVRRARRWGGFRDAPGRIRRRRSLKPRKRLKVTLYTEIGSEGARCGGTGTIW